MKSGFDRAAIDQVKRAHDAWERNEVATFLAKQAERKPQFFTLGDIPVKRTYTAADLENIPIEDIGLPGQYPFTAGPTRRCTEAETGRCVRSPGSALLKIPMSVSNTSLHKGRLESRP